MRTNTRELVCSQRPRTRSLGLRPQPCLVAPVGHAHWCGSRLRSPAIVWQRRQRTPCPRPQRFWTVKLTATQGQAMRLLLRLDAVQAIPERTSQQRQFRQFRLRCKVASIDGASSFVVRVFALVWRAVKAAAESQSLVVRRFIARQARVGRVIRCTCGCRTHAAEKAGGASKKSSTTAAAARLTAVHPAVQFRYAQPKLQPHPISTLLFLHTTLSHTTAQQQSCKAAAAAAAKGSNSSKHNGGRS